MILKRLLTLAVATALPLVAARSVEGQNVTLDEGAFVIDVEGRQVWSRANWKTNC